MTDSDLVLTEPEVAELLRCTPASITRRECQVLLLIGEGFGLGEIAERLGISAWTVRSHRDNGRRKLGARTTSQAVAIVTRRGVPA